MSLFPVHRWCVPLGVHLVLLGCPCAAGAQGTVSTPAVFSTCASAGARPLTVGEFRLCGDAGTRAEFIGNEFFAERDATRADDARFRQRMRVRAGVEYQAAKPLSIGFRLTSGDASFPTGAWSSMSDDFRRKPFQIDRAFLSWQATSSARVRVGLQANPLFTPTELLWDADAHPAGVSETISLGGGFVATAGQFTLREIRSSRPDNEERAFLFAQGLTNSRRWGNRTVGVGVSYYWFTNPNALSRSLQTGEFDPEFKTNRFDPRGRKSGTTPLDYFSDFRLLDIGVQVEDAAGKLGGRVEAVINLGARRSADLGEAFRRSERLAIGGEVRYGRSQRPGDWAVRAGFYHIEADAVVAVYNNDDLQQTNVNVAVGEWQLRFPGRARLVLDTYLQKKNNVALASNGGVLHPENALKSRSRVSFIVEF